jgi:hypothetical protein
MICVPTLSQEVGAALGAQVGEARLREVVSAGGFQSMRVNGGRVATWSSRDGWSGYEARCGGSNKRRLIVVARP